MGAPLSYHSAYFPHLEPYFPIGQGALPSSMEPYVPPRGAKPIKRALHSAMGALRSADGALRSHRDDVKEPYLPAPTIGRPGSPSDLRGVPCWADVCSKWRV